MAALGLGVATLTGAVLWGVVYGLVLFAIGVAFWMMMVLDISPDGKMVMGFGLFHLIYGVVLGAVIGLGLF